MNKTTRIQIEQIASQEDLQKIVMPQLQKYREFLQKNPEFNQPRYEPMLRVAGEKNIDFTLFSRVSARRIEEFENPNTPLETHELENIATDILRTYSGKLKNKDIPSYITDTKSPESFHVLAEILKKVVPTSWKETLQAYGYSEAEITKHDKKHPDTVLYNMNPLNRFLPAEYSSPAERSEKGTTLCSRTAQKNLARMGVKNPPGGGSARIAFHSYGKAPAKLPPEGGQDARIADIFLDATPKNAEHGHRAAAFKKNNQWYVLDPYYEMPGMGHTRRPIPLATYVNKFKQLGRKIWGAHYYG